ncbi:glycoside hydrolase [Ganoderma leucocontextum]|nr:glycoside hydrolase [Ganoderma leucocontextum]
MLADGQMFESGDGGLYAELLQNRAFQQVTPNTSGALTAWHALSNAQLTVIADSNPVSTSLPDSLQFSVPSGSSGAVGFTNEGFWGIKVNSSWTYKASFYYRFPASSSFSGTLTAGLRTNGGAILAQTTTQIRGTATNWTQVNLDLKPTISAPDNDNSFFISVDGAAAAGQTINFAVLSLFPPTFKDRMECGLILRRFTLAEMGPAFFCFPGGNNLGQTPATRWQWNATVGSLLDRPGRAGDWGYVNTERVLLLLPAFRLLSLTSRLAVVSGYALGGTSKPESALAGFIQQAKDQVTALRASLGHPEPFNLRFVEIGNECIRQSDDQTRRPEFLATPDVGSPVLSPVPPAYDVHIYQTPTWFYQNAFYYDSFVRDGTTYFEGEYAAMSASTGRLLWPTVASSAGEAAEFNSDIVFAASYAPLLQDEALHVNSTQWCVSHFMANLAYLVNLLRCSAGSVIKSTSFYAQKVRHNRPVRHLGDQYLPSTLPTNSGTLHCSGETFIKVANAGSASASITFDLTQFSIQNGPQTILPQLSNVTTGTTFTYNAPAFSISVITTTTN